MNISKEEIEQLMNSIGMFAQLVSVFHKCLIVDGMTEEQALYLTGKMVASMFTGRNGDDSV